MGKKVQLKLPKRYKVKVEQKRGLVFINGKKAQLVIDDTIEDVISFVKYNGEAGRVCYRQNNIIVKFNDSLWGQSQKEIKLWKKMKQSHRKFFSKILDWKDGKYGWIAVKVEEFEHMDKVPDELREMFDYLIDYYDIKDIFDDCPNNWAIRKDGSLIIYDFGL